MKKKLKQLQEDLDEKVDVKKERIRNFNLISYLHWRLGDRDKEFAALKHAEELENEPNLITQCNKILYFTELEKHYHSQELLEILKKSKDFKHIRAHSRATAEIGYCFSRLGPQHHDRAVQLFKKAIAGIAPERNILWEYGLLYEILKFPAGSYCRVKARAWCEMSKILYRSNLFEVIIENKKETEKINERLCFEEAIKLCPDEYFVLEKYGSHPRYTQNLKESKRMLERAIDLRDTAFSRNHLALTLKKMVEVANRNQKYRKKLQNSVSLVRRYQSKDHSYDSGISSLSQELASLSFATEQNGNIWKPHEPHTQHKSNLNTNPCIYQRFKSTSSVRQHEISWRK